LEFTSEWRKCSALQSVVYG